MTSKKRRVIRVGTFVLLSTLAVWFSARAQTPSSVAPSAQASTGIQVNPPPGWDPKGWAAIRQECQRLANKGAAGERLTRSEFDETAVCRAVGNLRTNPNLGTAQTPAASPLPTPSMLQLAPDAASTPSQLGPFGEPIAGESSANACAGQPPDVAADVSPIELVEFTNFGLQVWNKVTETPELSSTVSLFNFWCSGGSNGGTESCGTGNSLYDTQIAWDPVAQRWLATTGFFNPSTNEGDLYFAISQTADAAGAWSTYDISNTCSQIAGNSSYPFLDMPIVGYSGDWVVIEAGCFQPPQLSKGRGPDDTLVVIPNSTVAQNPLPASINVTPISAPFLDARPSRDIASTSTSSYPDLFLVADAPFAAQGPQLELASLDRSGAVTTLANSPSVGDVASSNQVPTVSCSNTSNPNCTIELGDSRPTSVILQTANDGFHYLMTSYAAENSNTSNGEMMYYLARAETLAGSSPLWNTWWVGGWPSSGGSASYPTVTADGDLDIAFSFQTFDAGSSQQPYNNWYESKGFVTSLPGIQSPPLLGYGINYDQTSSGNYTGCAANPAQRWGDYDTTVWDPSYSAENYPSPSGENSAFWTVSEFTTGGGNQSTNWVSLSDPLPFFVGYSSREKECGATGQECSVTLSAPAGVQPGDVLLADVVMGQDAKNSLPSVPTGWTILPITNQASQQFLFAKDGCGIPETAWLAAYIYGSQPGDTGSYTFSHFDNGAETCVGFFTSEILANMVAYRGAGQVTSNYTVYGFPKSTDGVKFTIGPISPPGQTELATLVYAPVDESMEDNGEANRFATPTGDPAITVETPLQNPLADGFLDADAGLPNASSSMGPYGFQINTDCTVVHGCIWTIFQVAIPEL